MYCATDGCGRRALSAVFKLCGRCWRKQQGIKQSPSESVNYHEQGKQIQGIINSIHISQLALQALSPNINSMYEKLFNLDTEYPVDIIDYQEIVERLQRVKTMVESIKKSHEICSSILARTFEKLTPLET